MRSGILTNREKAFHGISFDLLRLERILQEGILSEAASRERITTRYDLLGILAATTQTIVSALFNHPRY